MSSSEVIVTKKALIFLLFLLKLCTYLGGFCYYAGYWILLLSIYNTLNTEDPGMCSRVLASSITHVNRVYNTEHIQHSPVATGSRKRLNKVRQTAFSEKLIHHY